MSKEEYIKEKVLEELRKQNYDNLLVISHWTKLAIKLAIQESSKQIKKKIRDIKDAGIICPKCGEIVRLRKMRYDKVNKRFKGFKRGIE